MYSRVTDLPPRRAPIIFVSDRLAMPRFFLDFISPDCSLGKIVFFMMPLGGLPFFLLLLSHASTYVRTVA